MGRSRWLRWGIAGGGLVLVAGLVAVRMWAESATAPLVSGTPAPTPLGTRLEATVGPASSPMSSAVGTKPQRLAPEAFGPLPALALPGDGGFGPRYALTYHRSSTLTALPTSADVYRLFWPEFSEARVRALSRQLGLDGQVEVLAPGSYQVEDRARGRLFVAHGRIFYARASGTPAQAPINVGDATARARQWLRERSLLPEAVGAPRTRHIEEAGLITVQFPPAEPAQLITPEPSLAVTLDGSGSVHELDVLWPAEQHVSAYPLSGLPAAWEAIERGDGFVEISSDQPPMPGQRIAGEALLTQATIGYVLAAGADASEPAFLEPIYIFTGTVQLSDQTQRLPVTVYVPALRDYPWPRG